MHCPAKMHMDFFPRFNPLLCFMMNVNILKFLLCNGGHLISPCFRFWQKIHPYFFRRSSGGGGEGGSFANPVQCKKYYSMNDSKGIVHIKKCLHENCSMLQSFPGNAEHWFT